MKQIKKADDDLIEIQLVRFDSTSIIQYFNQLIINENTHKIPGYIDRVTSIEQIKSK